MTALFLLTIVAVVASTQAEELRVVTIRSANFVKGDNKTGFTGFIPDLLAAIGPVASPPFTVKITEQNSGKYGSRQAGGRWDGLIGTIISKSAEIAAADLSITAERDEFVDFATPYDATYVLVLADKTVPENKLKYLVVRSTSFESYLKGAANASQQAHDIWANIQAFNGIVKDQAEAAAKIRQGGFALVTDYVQAHPIYLENPEKYSLSTPILRQWFAFAVQQGSPLRDRIGIAISKINESGKLQELRDKYNLN